MSATSSQLAHKYASNSTDNPCGQRETCVGSINNNNRRIARTAAASRTQCRVDTRPGQCGASSLKGGNHTFPQHDQAPSLNRIQAASTNCAGWGHGQCRQAP